MAREIIRDAEAAAFLRAMRNQQLHLFELATGWRIATMRRTVIDSEDEDCAPHRVARRIAAESEEEDDALQEERRNGLTQAP